MKTGCIKRNLRKINKVVLSILMIATSFTVIPNTMKQVDAANTLKLIDWQSAPPVNTTLSSNNVYRVMQDMTIGSSSSGANGLRVASGATTFLLVPIGVTLNVYGGRGSGTTPGQAAIYLPSNATLYIIGDGRLNVYGGSSGTSQSGDRGGDGRICDINGVGCSVAEKDDGSKIGGDGGSGGSGAGGSGAGIGGNGGNGGSGGVRGYGPHVIGMKEGGQASGGDAGNGWSGDTGGTMGTVYYLSDGVVGGSGGSGASSAPGGSAGNWDDDRGSSWTGEYAVGGGGGGAGGGSTYSAYTIGAGTGGASGGAGGGGGGHSALPAKAEWAYLGGYGGIGAGGNGSDAWEPGKISEKMRGGYGGYGGNRGGDGSKGTLCANQEYVGGRQRDCKIEQLPDMLYFNATLDSQGADISVGTTSVKETLGMKNSDKITIPVKKGYDFKGYYAQRGGKGTKYYDHTGTAIHEWDYTVDTTLYAYWENTIFNYNTPDPITQNGITATVNHTPGAQAPYLSQVTSKVTLSGESTLTGAHLITLTSKTLEDEKQPFRIVIFVHIQQGTIATQSQSMGFEIPAQDITDFTLSHTVVTTPDTYNQSYPYNSDPQKYSLSKFPGLEIGALTYQKVASTEPPTETAPTDFGQYEVTIPIKESQENVYYYLKKQLDITERELEWVTDEVIANDKSYDGNTDASFSGRIKIKGVYEKDLGKVDLTDPKVIKGSFENNMSDTNKIVTIDVKHILLEGTRSENYKLPTKYPTMRADINGITPNIEYIGGGQFPDDNKPIPVSTTFDNTIQPITINGNVLDFLDTNVKEIIIDGDNEINLSYKYYKNTNGTIETIPDKDGSTEVGTAPKNAGQYFVRATYNPTILAPQYGKTNSKMIAYKIDPLAIPENQLHVEWLPGQNGFDYNGDQISHRYDETEIQPQVAVYTDSTKTTQLEKGKDYNITYKNNINAGSATAEIKLTNNYSGSKSKPFTINPGLYDMSPVKMKDQEFKYDKMPHGTEIDDIYELLKIDKTLKVSYRYTGKNGTIYDSATPPTEAGDYTVTATFESNNPNRVFKPGEHLLKSSLSIIYDYVNIKFDYKGGKVGTEVGAEWTDAKKYKKMSDHVPAVPKPLREGFDHKGWSSNKIIYSGNKINDEEVQKPLTYSAVWEAKDITVTFDANAGKFSSNSLETRNYIQKYGTILSFDRIEAPKLAKREFLGWSTSKTASTPDIATTFTFEDKDKQTYYAVWADEKFEISLNYNGGTDALGDFGQTLEIVSGEALDPLGTEIADPLPPTDGTNITTFKGWIDTDDATKKEFTSLELQKEVAKKDTTYLAQWDGDSFLVTFDNYNSEASTISFSVPKLTSGVTPASPTPIPLAGKKFKHWKVTKSDDPAIILDTEYTREQLLTISLKAAVTFEAVFEVIVYDVTFDLNTGDQLDTTPLIQKVEHEKTAIEPKTSKAGSEFLGWLNVNSGRVIDIGKIKEDKVIDNTLYIAQWKANINTVTLDSNGGSTPNRDIEVNYGDSIDVNETVPPVRPSYKFVGWASSEKIADEGIADIRGQIEVKENKTFYAVWSSVKYNVRFQDDDASPIAEADILENDKIGPAFATQPSPLPRTHAEFMGWKMDGEIPEVGKELDWNTIRLMDVKKKHTFTAVFKDAEYALTFDVNGGTDGPSQVKGKSDKVVALNDLKQPTPPQGMAFEGWFDAAVDGNLVDEVTLTQNTTVYAHYKVGDSSYKVSHWELGLNGSYALVKEDTYKGVTGALPDDHGMERTGFTFKQLKTTYQTSLDLEDTKKLPISSDGTLDIKYYYDRNSYKLDYVVEGASQDEIPAHYDRTYQYGETITVEDKLVKEGYGFQGWYGQGVIIANNLFVMPASDVKMVGQFNLARFRVNYEIEDVTNTTIVDNDSYRPADLVEVTNEVPQRDGYIFDGWMYEDKYVDVNELFVMPTKDVVFKASWHKEAYTLAFEDNNKIISEEVKWLGDVVDFPDLPARDYEVFLGWDVDGILYSGEGQYTVNEDTSVKFVAKWEVDRYDLSYKLNNGNKDEKVIFEKGKTNNLRLTAGRDGYDFKGWYLDESLQTKVDQLAPAQQEDMTLYAGWEKEKVVVQPQSGSVNNAGGITNIDTPLNSPIDKKVDEKAAAEVKKDTKGTSNATKGISKDVSREAWRYFVFPIWILLYLGAYALIWNKKKEEEVD